MNFYKSAALAIDHLDKYQGSVKGSIAAAGVRSDSPGETKRILALIIETLKYRQVLQQILSVVPLLSLERLTFPKRTPPRTPSSANLVIVLLHDLLFSSKTRIEASDKWPPKDAVIRHQARLRAELVRIQLKEGKSRKEDLSKQAVNEGEARYVRWNPNVDLHRAGDWSLQALLHYLQDRPLSFTLLGKPTYPVPANCFFLDPHLPECLLVFPSSSSWWTKDKWFQAGAIILQDKASCFPPKILMEGWNNEGDCLDATAAPGNKTSYVSALMGDQRQVFAFERSHIRYKTLEMMLERAQCGNVVPKRADFLDADPRSPEWSGVTRILLDPSCSGSGIVNRLDYLVDGAETDSKAERLDKLAAFQLQMILHAFKFPAVRRITYSTCSIHAEEDEQVVWKALQSFEAKQTGWHLAPKNNVLPNWSRRGRTEEMSGVAGLADCVIRCLPGEDKTNGFFVACFIREDPRPLKGTKRSAPEADDDVDANLHASEDELPLDDINAEYHDVQPKSTAQLERKKRKRREQKKRRRDADPTPS